MSNNCQRPELCMLSETCIPCAICPNAKEKADDRLALTACSEVAVPLLIWAELNGERFERTLTMTLPIGPGHCPGLAKAEMAKATAAILAGYAIRTGYEIDPQNAQGMAAGAAVVPMKSD